MIKLRKNPNYLILATLSVLTVFTWIGLEVYNLLSKPIKITIPRDHLVPVKTDFDQEMLDALNQRLSISDQELNQVESRLKKQLIITEEIEEENSSNSPTPTPETAIRTSEPTPSEASIE